MYAETFRNKLFILRSPLPFIRNVQCTDAVLLCSFSKMSYVAVDAVRVRRVLYHSHSSVYLCQRFDSLRFYFFFVWRRCMCACVRACMCTSFSSMRCFVICSVVICVVRGATYFLDEKISINFHVNSFSKYKIWIHFSQYKCILCQIGTLIDKLRIYNLTRFRNCRTRIILSYSTKEKISTTRDKERARGRETDRVAERVRTGRR